jgi:hypothetical protein
MALLEMDLRCLDAHAHLGNLWFDGSAAEALRHYEVGVGIRFVLPAVHARQRWERVQDPPLTQ